METSLGDVVRGLQRRGRLVEAMGYQMYVTTYLEMMHGIPREAALRMDIDRVVALMSLPPRPLKYQGWDSFYWGRAKFAGDHD